MMDTVAVFVFWIGGALLVYGYAGYPLLIWVLARARGRPPVGHEFQPHVSLLVPAYNEGRAIDAKIQNCLQLAYPKDRLEILVASDGSTDATADHIEQATRAGLVRGVVYPTRRGKAAVLNDLVEMASGQILVLSDATSMLEPGSLLALVSHFADPRVGCVSGIYRIVPREGDGKAGPEALYWRYETFIRQSEARLGRMLGAHGSMYGFRRELFDPLEPGTRNEDFIIPVTMLLKGHQVVYDTRAVAWEEADEMTGFGRRVSLAAGNYQQLALLWRRRGWLRRPSLLLQIASHKVLRLLSPFLILGVYGASACLLDSPLYRSAFALETLFFIAAASGISRQWRRRGRAVVAGPYYFCLVNLAGLVALHRIRRPRRRRAGGTPMAPPSGWAAMGSHR